MKTLNSPVSACRYCQFYNPMGRRGGCCQTLGVTVQGGWQGCQLGIPQFKIPYEYSQEDSQKQAEAIVI